MEHLNPIHLAFFDLVEFLFHVGRKFDVQNIRKMFHQKINHDFRKFCGHQSAAFAFDIFTGRQRINNGRVRTRPADSFFLKHADEARVIVTRGRFRKMLGADQFMKPKDFILVQFGKFLLFFLFIIFLGCFFSLFLHSIHFSKNR